MWFCLRNRNPKNYANFIRATRRNNKISQQRFDPKISDRKRAKVSIKFDWNLKNQNIKGVF